MRNKRVFNSVFGATNISQPTPVASPATHHIAPGQPFGGPAGYSSNQGLKTNVGGQLDTSQLVRDQVIWDRSWHTVTHALHLPDILAFTSSTATGLSELVTSGATFYNALDDVLNPQARLPLATHTESIIIWHTQQVRQHFFRQVVPQILRWKDEGSDESLLFRSVEVFRVAHRHYFQRLSIILEQVKPLSSASVPTLHSFRQDFHAIVGNSIADHLSPIISVVLRRFVFNVLGLSLEKSDEQSVSLPKTLVPGRAGVEMLGLVQALQNVGLAGESFQIIFAEIMNDSMSHFVQQRYSGIWSSKISEDGEFNDWTNSVLPRTAHRSAPSRCVVEICEWIENHYTKVIVQVLNKLENPRIINEETYKDLWFEKEKYKEIGIGSLAELRVVELFDIVSNWPHSKGALEDLRTAITTPERRLHLTDIFARTLNERLLHPGTSTLQILRTYVSMIWSFHALDHSKVLLDRVAFPLQLYLCSREDTVRIVIAGLLAQTKDLEGNAVKPDGDKLVELALLLEKSPEQLGYRVKDEELDWHDMLWLPDPVDAGPGYKRSKNADIIGTLLGVLGSQEVFIKEFQSIIGENLLNNDGGFETEIHVLELLKAKFGEASLQSCEVMLKDIKDSVSVNQIIRKHQKFVMSDQETAATKGNVEMSDGETVDSEDLGKPSLHARILSRLFWPQLHDESHRIPTPISDLQSRYEEGFEALKSSRKLTWLHALGKAIVELEFPDRKVIEEVHTWQASLIWSFQSPGDIDNSPQRSVRELVDALDMDEVLVRSSIKFWVNKLVLQETAKDVFTVRETLNQEDRAKSAAQNAADDESKMGDDRGENSNGEDLKEKMQMYWQFTQGMLRNSSSQMPLQQIAMMLKMLIVDGFPHSNEDLAEFLSGKVAEGELELIGGKYKLKR